MTTPDPNPADSSANVEKPAARKTWSAGTRVYTLGTLVALFAWLLIGDFAWATRERSVGPMAQWYLNSLQIPNLLFGLLITSFPAALWLVLGPIISMKSDRHRGPRGRRIPFLLTMAPLAGLGIVGIGLTPLLAGWLHAVLAPEHAWGSGLHGALDGTAAGAWMLEILQNERIVAVCCFGIFWAMYELATIAVPTLLGGLINDVVPKPLLGRFYGLFRAVGLIDGMIFNFWLMGKVPTHFTLMLVIIGITYTVAFMWMCFQVKEGDYPPPEPQPERRGLKGWWTDLRRYVRECFTNSYYLSVFVMWMFASLCFQPVNVFALPYARSLGVDMDLYGKMLALTFLVSLGFSYFLGWLVDKFHPLRMVMVSLAAYAAVTLTGSLYATTANAFLVAWVLHGVFSGCYYTCVASLGQRLFPHHKYAQFFSASSIFLSLANIVLAPAIGWTIDATGKVYRLTFLFGGGLAALALVCAFFVYRKFMRLGGPKDYAAPE
ncbi:MFS transporter [Nibricoccus aquaticus]|uniref:MFS transporter n=1 Tax=Nibricoccus aquaticus TaxID=2576891 RepID=A0A290QB03_9BACT|nr:MFS transporter [Nibricoccus aquaticus]ATC65427.1 MFS transporter [Nibricoccus aquaticus]